MAKHCKKCGAKIPNRKLINGKLRSLTSRSYCLDCSPYIPATERQKIAREKARSDPLFEICENCGGKKYINRKCKTCSVREMRRKRKQMAITYMGGKCMVCGYDRCPGALQFHHINPDEKDFTIGDNTPSWTKIKKELEKCIMVCANCHAELHAGLIDINDYINKSPPFQEGITGNDTEHCLFEYIHIITNDQEDCQH